MTERRARRLPPRACHLARLANMPAPAHCLAFVLVSIVVASAGLASAATPPFQASKLSVKSAVNQKAFETWAVKGSIIDQFTRCRPPPLNFAECSSEAAGIAVRHPVRHTARS